MLGSRIPGLFRFRSQLRRRSSLFLPSRRHISLDLQPKTSILHSLLFNSLRNCQNKNHFHRYPVSKKIFPKRERERERERENSNKNRQTLDRSRTRRPQQKGKKQHTETLLLKKSLSVKFQKNCASKSRKLVPWISTNSRSPTTRNSRSATRGTNAGRFNEETQGRGREEKMDKHDGQLAAQPSPTWMQCEQGTCLPWGTSKFRSEWGVSNPPTDWPARHGGRWLDGWMNGW
jgi:hypothetical protein